MSTEKDEKNDYYYTKFTTVGYFFLGALVLCTGFVYAPLNDDIISFNVFLNIIVDLLSDNWREMILALLGSSIFYWIFFCVRKGMQAISNKFINTKEENKITETLKLRETYELIKKKKNNNDHINEQDIDNFVEDECVRNALKEWLKIESKIKRLLLGYFVGAVIVVVIFPGVSKTGYVPWFFITYTFMFIFSSMYYVYLFSNLFLESFIRLSYSVFYPTILSIAVNLFFGLSMNMICLVKPLLSVFIPIVIFALFFIVTAIFEITSYKKVKADKFSSRGFVWTCVILLSISIIGFGVAIAKIFPMINTEPFSNQLFAIALSLFLGIFEGWDALKQMQLNEESEIFANHYRWWNFLQVCYPLAFFFLMGAVNSEIFTFGLMITFTFVSVASTIVWKRGGEREEYNQTDWGKLKLIFGVSTIVFIFINRLLFMNEKFILKTPPKCLNTKDINIELILFFIGLISSIFIFLGDVKEQKINVIKVLPFINASGYRDFYNFYVYGFIYDFSNYIYLFYILVVHVLLFSTNLIPKSSEQFESASTLLVILMVIIYMLLSFKAKIIQIHQKVEKTEKAETQDG